MPPHWMHTLLPMCTILPGQGPGYPQTTLIELPSLCLLYTSVVKCHILQDVTLSIQNSTDLDRIVDKYSWWSAAVATSTK